MTLNEYFLHEDLNGAQNQTLRKLYGSSDDPTHQTCSCRVTTFDLRSGACVASLYGHQLGVTAVQADEWKVVSGGGEGLVCVWETRMRAKLWEMHNRWVEPATWELPR